jgi:hypothetical protein
MLTAAEQRAQNVKADKKVNEEMYAFLKDPKDVGASFLFVVQQLIPP